MIRLSILSNKTDRTRRRKNMLFLLVLVARGFHVSSAKLFLINLIGLLLSWHTYYKSLSFTCAIIHFASNDLNMSPVILFSN